MVWQQDRMRDEWEEKIYVRNFASKKSRKKVSRDMDSMYYYFLDGRHYGIFVHWWEIIEWREKLMM